MSQIHPYWIIFIFVVVAVMGFIAKFLRCFGKCTDDSFIETPGRGRIISPTTTNDTSRFGQTERERRERNEQRERNARRERGERRERQQGEGRTSTVSTISDRIEIAILQPQAREEDIAFGLQDLPPSYEDAIRMQTLPE